MEDGVEGSAIMAASLLIHRADVMATKKIMFIEKWERARMARGSKNGLVGAERAI